MKIIEIPIYNLEILAFDSFKDLRKYSEKHNADTGREFERALAGGAACAGFLSYPDTDECELFLAVDIPTSPSLLETLESVVHESLHCCYFLLDVVGVHHDVENHESATYLQQWIFSQYVKKFKVMEREFDNP